MLKRDWVMGVIMLFMLLRVVHDAASSQYQLAEQSTAVGREQLSSVCMRVQGRGGSLRAACCLRPSCFGKILVRFTSDPLVAGYRYQNLLPTILIE